MAGTTYGYTYDSNGNILTISKNGALAESYVYDGLNQLVRENSVTQNKTVVYEYDNRGNITSKKTYAYTAGEITGTPTDEVVYSYNNSQWKDMLTAYDGENITYDGIGNPITYRNGISFTWKNGRRLASYTDGVYNITYNYTDGGIRKNKTVNGETTEYLLSGSQIMQERRPNGDILNYARDESGGLVGFDYYSAAENVINFYYYLKNMQGDIVGITDRQGNVLVTYTYDTWGKLISITGSMANTIGIINPFRYRGYYYDTETGLYYVSSRYYDPEIGRWLNADGQISGVGGEVLGYNMFAYCMNNPVNMSDPTGDWPLNTISKFVKIVVCVIIVSTIVNHIVNAKNKNKINKEIQEKYTKESAKNEIDKILGDYGDDVSATFNDTGVEITNSVKVKSRYDRQKISTIITRTENVTKREFDDISAEWLFHNIAYDLHIKRDSAISANLDYSIDSRWYVVGATDLLEIFGWE